MNISRRVRALVAELALWAGLGVFCLAILLAGVGFLIAGFYLWLSLKESEPAAAAITGGVLIVIAGLVALIGSIVVRKTRKPQPSMLAEFGGTVGMAGRLVGLLVRRDPRKAMVVAAMVGALAEIIVTDRKK